jgi:hypothetical protein
MVLVHALRFVTNACFVLFFQESRLNMFQIQCYDMHNRKLEPGKIDAFSHAVMTLFMLRTLSHYGNCLLLTSSLQQLLGVSLFPVSTSVTFNQAQLD